MFARSQQVLQVRSHLAEEVINYLDQLSERSAELPSYYPAHLRTSESGKTPFDEIRQVTYLIEDRTSFEQWLAEERERMRAAGQDFDRLAYNPRRSRPEVDEAERELRPSLPIVWDEGIGRRLKRAVILGDPGFGKTWLLRYEARRLARHASNGLREHKLSLDELVLPILARFSDLNRAAEPIDEVLVTLIGRRRSAAFRRWVSTKLETDRSVMLLDAWDEVPVERPGMSQSSRYESGYRQRLAQQLETFAYQFPNPQILCTSRIVGYAGSPIPGAQELEILAFDTPQIESFVRVWFRNKTQIATRFLALLRENDQLRGLARIPLMSALICRVFNESKRHTRGIPSRRVGLYDRCLRGLLRDWKEEKQGYRISDVQVTSTLSRLAQGALRLHLDSREQFTEVRLAEALEFDLKLDIEVRRARQFIETVKADGVLITAGEHRDAPLLFLHRTFHEYLAASALAKDRRWLKTARTD
jgi:predicted NACHT family NTPase